MKWHDTSRNVKSDQCGSLSHGTETRAHITHEKPTHALSLRRASPFLGDVIIIQAVEKSTGELEAVFERRAMCFYPERRQESVGDVLLSGQSLCHALRLLQETNKMFHNYKQHLVLNTWKQPPACGWGPGNNSGGASATFVNHSCRCMQWIHTLYYDWKRPQGTGLKRTTEAGVDAKKQSVLANRTGSVYM